MNETFLINSIVNKQYEKKYEFRRTITNIM